jgi:hypothetical protein
MYFLLNEQPNRAIQNQDRTDARCGHSDELLASDNEATFTYTCKYCQKEC